jgi:beta-galactosidase
MVDRKLFGAAMAAALFAATWGYAETYTPEPSDRVEINMGVTPWKFTKGDPNGATTVAFNDGGWKTVGVPHTVNDDDTYVNNVSGDSPTYGGMMCYRKHFTLPATYANRKVFIDFGGVNMGAAVYINGTFIKGNSALNPNSTHVYGFIPFIVDATPYVHFDGTDNVLTVRASNGGGIYNNTGFGGETRFGQHDGGLFRPVWMHITNKVYVPANVYSIVNNWGTCVGTVSATDASATVRLMTHVMNESGAAQNVTVTTKVVDASNTVVLTNSTTQSIDAGKDFVFDQSGDIANPKLWYPANSIYGKPNMHKVYHIVKIGGTTVDVFKSPLGIRKITWDKNFPYFNGHMHYMWGMSGRYNYPALGSAMPDEMLWKDVKLTVDCGGTIWRPGHSACAHEYVEGCDAFGVLVDQPSGDGEGAWQANNMTADMWTLKKELHRDMVIHDRNNPSILMWEVTNAGIIDSVARQLRAIARHWDTIELRAQSDRSYLDGCKAAISDVIECSSAGCEAGQKNNPACTNLPAFGAEGWDAGPARASRFAYDYELAFGGAYMQNWKASWKANAFGTAHWYLAEPPGEVGQFLGDARTARSFGSSVMDANRIPKMLYHMYRVAWIPYAVKPGVAIAHHWNRGPGTVRVNVFSNCPKVRLSLNGNVISEKVPNTKDGIDGNWRDQATTGISYQCYWDVTWASGTLKAEGLDANGAVVCTDQKVTALDPDHIQLTVEPNLQKPDGTYFKTTANGTDAVTVLAKVVDKNNNWCPTVNSTITFATTGPCEYRGGTDAFVTAGTAKGYGYHAPLDPELNAEGGMTKIAIRSTFTPGTVGITATSPGLGQGTASYTVYPVDPTSTIDRPKAVAGISGSTMAFLEVKGNAVRYYLNASSTVGFEILNATGRVIARIDGTRQSEGWHTAPLMEPALHGGHAGNGVYFVRTLVNEKNLGAKRLLVMK